MISFIYLIHSFIHSFIHPFILELLHCTLSSVEVIYHWMWWSEIL